MKSDEPACALDAPPSADRSALMARVRGKDTLPEIKVRRALHALGYRFRLHRRDLPGKPDIVLPRHKLVIFVHGCFWHRHPGCRMSSTPKTRTDFWQAKFAANIARDAHNVVDLCRRGWLVETIWECETKAPGLLSQRLDQLQMLEFERADLPGRD